VKKKLKSVNIWQSYKQERDCLMHDFARLANTLLKDEESLLGDKKIRKTELQVQQSGNFCAAWPQGCMTR